MMIATLGDEVLATRVYSWNLTIITYVWSLSIAVSSQIVIARYAGAKDFDAVHIQLNQSMRASFLGSCLFALLVYLNAESLFYLFTKNDTIIQVGLIILAIELLAAPVRSMLQVLSFSLRACGDSTYPAVWNNGISVCVGIPLCYVLSIPLEFSVIGIWVGIAAEESIHSLVLYFRWRQGCWREKGVVDDMVSKAVDAVKTESEGSKVTGL
jgi:Na+-driven multidrug efflux pump